MLLGSTVGGKYRIERLLGEGGMGAVYQAVHVGTNRRVALKVILGNGAQHGPEVIARFVREAKAAGAIDTQHIVQVLDFGVDEREGIPYLAMEFLAGEDLEQLTERLGPLSPELAIRIVGQASIGLQKAHEAGVVHRDIKPANLYLARRDGGEIIVKVLDFGIAKIKLDHLGSGENQQLTRTGSVLGSPRYMSPEQAKGLRTIDQRTDIWSLGAVLYQALTGRTPHHDLETLGQLIIAICSESPAPVQDHAPWVSPELAAVVRGMLTLDVAQRFPSAAALHDALRALRSDGFALHESMLRPLAPEQRAVRARRLEPIEARSLDGSRLDGHGPTVSLAGLGGTQQGLARTTGASGKSSARLWVGAGLLVAIGSAGAYFGLAPRSGPESSSSAAGPVAELVKSAVAAPSVVASAGPSPSAELPVAAMTSRAARADAPVKPAGALKTRAPSNKSAKSPAVPGTAGTTVTKPTTTNKPSAPALDRTFE